jgi:hypothetical protein
MLLNLYTFDRNISKSTTAPIPDVIVGSDAEPIFVRR